MRLVEPFLRRNPWMDSYDWGRGPSAHLSWTELDCRDSVRYPLDWRIPRAVPLSVEFEWIRSTLGGTPIGVGSGYRTKAWNRKVGGARNSQHVEGRALDLYPPEGKAVADLVEAALAVARRPGGLIRGIGVYSTFVHVDIRPVVGRVCRWEGRRRMAEAA